VLCGLAWQWAGLLIVSNASLLLSPRAKTAEHLLGVFAFGSKKTGKESMMPPIEP
jgi:hypothetical protein